MLFTPSNHGGEVGGEGYSGFQVAGMMEGVF